VVCSIVANCFGDRWTYVQVNGYMWVLGGLVSRGLALEESGEPLVSVGNDAVGAPTEVSEDLNPQPA
jgi:hypothetical protein